MVCILQETIIMNSSNNKFEPQSEKNIYILTSVKRTLVAMFKIKNGLCKDIIQTLILTETETHHTPQSRCEGKRVASDFTKATVN